ncbi:MAG: oligosaccharide flippase family protein [Victivallaceae bacterium]|nr:oligosaccharide flippase family protein [Victivallaceae bacterium]
MNKILKMLKANRRIGSAIFWNMAGASSAKVLLLGCSYLTALMLSVDDFGRFGLIRNTIAMFSIILSFGVGLAATKHIAECRERDPLKARQIMSINFMAALVISVVVMVSIIALSPLLANSMLEDPALAGGICVAATYVFFNGLGGVVTGVLSGLEAFYTLAWTTIVGSVFGIIVIIIFTHQWGLNGLIAGYAIMYAAIFFIQFIAMLLLLKKNHMGFTLHGLTPEIKVLSSFCVPAIISGAIGGPVVWGANVIMSKSVGGFFALGIYNAALIAKNSAVQMGGQLHVPMSVLFFNSPDSKKINGMNKYISWLIAIVFVYPVIVMPELVTWIFRHSKYTGQELTQCVALSMAVGYIMLYKHYYARVLTKHEKLWWGVWENIFWGVLTLVFTYWWSKYGAVGFAWAMLAAYIIDLIGVMIFYGWAGLISRDYLLSKECCVLWMIFGVGLIAISLGIPWQYRLLLLCVSIATEVWCILNIYKKLVDN